MTKPDKYIELIKKAFSNIAKIQKTPYTETEASNDIIKELANALGTNYNSGNISVSSNGINTIKHDLGYEPVVSLITVNCTAYISSIDSANILVEVTSVNPNAIIKIIAG